MESAAEVAADCTAAVALQDEKQTRENRDPDLDPGLDLDPDPFLDLDPDLDLEAEGEGSRPLVPALRPVVATVAVNDTVIESGQIVMGVKSTGGAVVLRRITLIVAVRRVVRRSGGICSGAVRTTIGNYRHPRNRRGMGVRTVWLMTTRWAVTVVNLGST